MVLRPVIKASSSRQRVADWIVERFPAGYQEMSYLEPFLGDGSVLLAKARSAEEVVSDSDLPLMSVWRALRDECVTFSSRVKRIEHSRSTFERHSKSPGEDYMGEAVREFVLRHMSKSALKKTYLPRNGKVKCKDCWCDLFDRMPDISARLRGVFMLNNDAIGVMKAFNHEGCLAFLDPPNVEPGMSDFHVELGEVASSFRGKVLVCAKNSAMYKRIYAQWNRKGLPGGGNESLWTNF